MTDDTGIYVIHRFEGDSSQGDAHEVMESVVQVLREQMQSDEYHSSGDYIEIWEDDYTRYPMMLVYSGYQKPSLWVRTDAVEEHVEAAIRMIARLTPLNDSPAAREVADTADGVRNRLRHLLSWLRLESPTRPHNPLT